MPLLRVGYACVPLGAPGLRSPRTTVLRLATPERLRALIAANLDGLAETLRYNARQGIGLFRIGTQFIPFASHPANSVPWAEEFGPALARVGALAVSLGLRLSFHVTQYTLLNSLQPGVAEAALADVEYQARALDAMALDATHRVVIHAGITRPTRPEARDRLLRAVDRLSEGARRRIAIENDERFWSIAELVEIARAAGVPALFDVFHHRVRPGVWERRPLPEILREVFATWSPADGPPKMHFSSQDPAKRPGAHGEYVEPGELDAFLAQATTVGTPFDLMFEAKAKDLAVLRAAPILERYGVLVGAPASRLLDTAGALC